MSVFLLLEGLGGASLGLPLLEGLTATTARAQTPGVEPYAIFVRQANGVAQAGTSILGAEPERFFPMEVDALTPTARGPFSAAQWQLEPTASHSITASRGELHQDGRPSLVLYAGARSLGSN